MTLPTETETVSALRLADRILNRPSGDPDDDLAVLARQFIRAAEAASRIDPEARTFYDRCLVNAELRPF